ncbi:MAG: RecB family exonuclease [Pirellulales bacterium]
MSTELLTRETLQDRKGDVWSYVSPSRLNLWLKCPLAFRLRYVEGIATTPSPSMFVGKMVHAALEHFYRHRQLGIPVETGDICWRLAESWDEAAAEEGVAFASVDEEQALRGQTAALVVAYLAQVPEEEPRPLAVEATAEAPLVDPATGEDFGIPLVGIMDLVVDDRDGAVIADFKTAARGGEPLEITHEIQLSSYAYLFRQTSTKEEAGLEIRSLVKTKTPKIECHHYGVRTEAHFRRLFAVIRAYLDDLDAGRFVFRPGWGCGMCDYRHPHCRQWCG